MSPTTATNKELHDLLEQAAENATGNNDTDIEEFLKILEDEWITDVASLRKLNSDALDELLPLLLSQEVQRLAHHQDDDDDEQTMSYNRVMGYNRSRLLRRSPPRKKLKLSSLPPSLDGNKISRIAIGSKPNKSSPAIFNSVAPATIIRSKKVSSSSNNGKTKKKKGLFLFNVLDLFDHFCSHSFKNDEEPNDLTDLQPDDDDDEGIDDDQLQQMANTNPLLSDGSQRARHLIADADRKAHIVATARKRYATREALEDAIRDCHAQVRKEETEEAAAGGRGIKNSRFDTERKLVSAAEDELRSLYPLRLILPTVADLTEMIVMLQRHREKSMRNLDMVSADSLQREIDELQYQIDEEERYLLKKRLVEVACVACGEAFVPLSAGTNQMAVSSCSRAATMKTKEKHCEKCQQVFGW